MVIKYFILCFWLLTIVGIFPSYSQDTNKINVQFLYGSKPLKKFKATEKKWFGGLMGGHVGIEKGTNQFLSFEGNDKFHLIDHRNKRHCRYKLLDATGFWGIMGSNGDSVQRVTITIPVNAEQKNKLDRIAEHYVQQAPYDYSVFGMRCASATYEVLAQLGIVKSYRYRGTCLRIFYPSVLRKKLLRRAAKEGWIVSKQQGSIKRKWERD